MSAGEASHHPHEIIIVKHGGGDHEDGHHGGVWKIAFADFMTAMMCFFLVMWLINAANEPTKAAVASYFNPVKLIDRNSSRKGLEDVGDGPNAIGQETDNPSTFRPKDKSGTQGPGQGGPRDMRDSQDTKDKEEHSDEHLFSDPYAVLAEIAGETGVKQNISSKGDGGAQTAGPATGASGGESYRDPFQPDFWTKQVDAPIETEPSIEAPAGSGAAKVAKADEPVQPQATASEAAKPKAAAQDESGKDSAEIKAGDKAETKPEDKAEAKPEDKAQAKPDQAEAKPEDKTQAKTDDKPKADGDAAPSSKAVEEAKEIKRQIAEAMGTGDKLGNGLDVVATDKGVTISVTDDFDFGMFEVGSALPRRELVLAMEKIGKVLAAQKGSITINGHTDARPFKSDTYDNWRLSTARAHSAYYMLVRAGLDENRIKEVAGFADRQLKVKDDPLNAANRRIEILLEVDG
jgi:chemotaxis protein MotB